MQSRIVFEDSNATAYQWGKYTLGLGRHYTWQKSDIASRNKYRWSKYNAVQVEEPTYIWGKYGLVEANQYYTWDRAQYGGVSSYAWDKYNIIPAGTVTYNWSKNYPQYLWGKFQKVEVPVYNYTYSINNSYTTFPAPSYAGSDATDKQTLLNADITGFVKIGTATFDPTTSKQISGNYTGGVRYGTQTSISTTTGIQSLTSPSTYNARYLELNSIADAAVGDRILGLLTEMSNAKLVAWRPAIKSEISSINYPAYCPITALSLDPGYYTAFFPDGSSVSRIGIIFIKESNTTAGVYVAGINNYGVTYTRTPTGQTTIEKGTFIESVTSTNRNTYPDDDYDDNYYYVYDGYSAGAFIESVVSDAADTYPDKDIQGDYYYIYTGRDVAYVDKKGTLDSSVTSEDRRAYPDNGVTDGYWYVYTGQSYKTQYYQTGRYLQRAVISERIYYSDTKPTLNRDTGQYTLAYKGVVTSATVTTELIAEWLSQGYKYFTTGGYSGRSNYYELLPTTTKYANDYGYNNLLQYQRSSAAGPIEEYGNYLGIQLENPAYYQQVDPTTKAQVKGNFIEEVESNQDDTYPKDGPAAGYYWVYSRQVGQESIGKGTYVEDVTAYALDTYPQDGAISGFWYVYQDYELEYYQGDIITEVNSLDQAKYPQNGIQEGYWYKYTGYSDEDFANEFVDFVTYPDRSYYPTNGEKNGYWYIYISPVGADLYTITTSEMTKQVSYSQCVNTTADYTIGDAVSATAEFEILDPDKTATKYTGLKFRYYTQMPNDNQWRLVGKFNTKEIDRVDEHSVKIVGYDEVSLFDIYVDDWIDSVTWPMTLKDMFQSLCSYCGAKFISTDFTNSNFIVKDNFTGINTTGRQVLGYIAQAAASFIYADANGIITIKQYSETGTAIDKTKYTTAVVSDYVTPLINKLTIQMTETDLGVSTGDGDVVYKITNNPLFYTENEDEISTAANHIFSVIKQVNYTPCTISMLEDYGINCGDIITIDGKSTYIMTKSITPEGVELTSLGTKDREATGEETNSEIIALRGKTNELTRDLEQTKSTITDTAEELRSEITQTANTINAKIDYQGETISQLQLGLDGIKLTYNAEAGTASITIGDMTVSNLVDGKYVDEVVAGINIQGYVKFTDLQTAGATTINGSNITTGTISADRLALTGSIAWGDLSNATKAKIIEYAEDAASSAAEVPSYIHSTYIDETDIYSPNIYGAKITAGTSSDGFIRMQSNGMEFRSSSGGSLIGMGYYPGKYNFPYFLLGGGIDTYGTDRGMIKKYSNGIWIGDSDGVSSSTVGSGTGLFVRFTDNTLWKYENGKATKL